VARPARAGHVVARLAKAGLEKARPARAGLVVARPMKAFCAALMAVLLLVALAPLGTYAPLGTFVPLAAHAAGGPLVITVHQIFTASAPGADGAFTYRMEPLAHTAALSGGNAAEGCTLYITGTGSEDIELSGFDQRGVYKYRLYQVIEEARPGYTYDRRVYAVDVYVDGALGIKVVAYDEEGTKVDSISFHNEYGVQPSDPALMADPPVRKTVFGNPPRSSEFIFRLEARDKENPMPPGSDNGVKQISVTGSGAGEFGVWGYESEGVYYYTVYEVGTGEKGYTYDTAVYTITDMVKAENGVLILSRVVTNSSNRPVTSLIFNNYYDAGAPTPTGRPPGTPTPTGRPPGTHVPSITPGPTATPVPTATPATTATPSPSPSPEPTGRPNRTGGPGANSPQQPGNTPPTRLSPGGSEELGEPPFHMYDLFDPNNPLYGANITNRGNGAPDRPVGINSPKTGDELSKDAYIMLFAAGGAAVIGAAFYLISVVRRERGYRQI